MNFKNNQTEIRNCIVFASYKEFENLEILLREVSSGISKDTLLLVCDDSGIIHQERVKSTLIRLCAIKTSPTKYHLHQINLVEVQPSAEVFLLYSKVMIISNT